MTPYQIQTDERGMFIDTDTRDLRMGDVVTALNADGDEIPVRVASPQLNLLRSPYDEFMAGAELVIAATSSQAAEKTLKRVSFFRWRVAAALDHHQPAGGFRHSKETDMEAKNYVVKAYIKTLGEIGLDRSAMGRPAFDRDEACDRIEALKYLAGQAVYDLCRFFIDAGYDDLTRRRAILALRSIAEQATGDVQYSANPESFDAA